VFACPDAPEFDGLRESAKAQGFALESFSTRALTTKPLTLQSERWQLPGESFQDHWPGSVLAAITAHRKWDHVIVIALENLLVDREGIRQSLALHLEEGFDVTFSEDRLVGANWVIFHADLLAGLQKAHPDIMATRGGLFWAIKKPLYPFKIGEYNNPRHPMAGAWDLRLKTSRVASVFQCEPGPGFAEPGFQYNTWVQDVKWLETFTNAGPQILYLEPTSRCAGNCVACPQPRLQRPRADLSPELFQVLLQGFPADLDLRIVFSGLGEPLLHPQFAAFTEQTRHIHSTLHTSLQPGVPTEFPWHHLDMVRISLDATTPQAFEQNRPGCSWPAIHAFLKAAAQRKLANPNLEPEIGISFLRHQQNAHQASDFIHQWSRMCVPTFLAGYFQWPLNAAPEEIQWYQILGSSDYLNSQEPPFPLRYTPMKRRHCRRALSGFHVLSNGTVVICPYDTEGRWPLGDLAKSSPMEIWNSALARDFRSSHIHRQWLPGYPCQSCQDWYHQG
jgi:organic radical activating enzyme